MEQPPPNPLDYQGPSAPAPDQREQSSGASLVFGLIGGVGAGALMSYLAYRWGWQVWPAMLALLLAVKASVGKLAANKVAGAYKDSHYRSVYFHNSGPEAERKYENYLSAIAKAVAAFRQKHNVFVVMVATERLDARPAGKIAEKLGGVPVLSSGDYDMYQIVSILRACHMMASSRYHGIVTSMPGLLPSCGITMDERIRNLMRERGHQDLLMNVDDPDLEPRLLAALEHLYADGESVATGIGKTVVKNLKVMARMGVHFEEEGPRREPDVPTRTGAWSWEDYLPPMHRGLQELVERFDTSAESRKPAVAS
jgi:hypothetical protein